jgi:aminoglycoside phosphotransferase (APT) family kinase protein
VATAQDQTAGNDSDALAVWLRARLPDAAQVHVGEFGRPRSGFSAETLMFDTIVESRDGATRTERLVLRREVPDPAVYPQQAPGLDVEIDIQYRCMAALAEHGTVPVARLVGYEPDASVLGAPFFVMGFVDGDVPTESPPYAETGFFVDATAEQRTRMIEDGIHNLARLHQLDWHAAGLQWLVPAGVTPGTDRQLGLWRAYAERELAGRRHPLLQETFEWLATHVPTRESIGFCWGDPRPGNIIWRDFNAACLTDFEAASIASPEQDVGWWLMFDRTMHPDGTRLPGDPTRDQQLAMYRDFSGRDATNISYHEVFAAARYCAIVVRVMNRLVARGDLPEDHTIWLHNPAVSCLQDMHEEGMLG